MRRSDARFAGRPGGAGAVPSPLGAGASRDVGGGAGVLGGRERARDRLDGRSGRGDGGYVCLPDANGAWTFWSYYQRQGFCHNGARVNSLYDYLRRNNGTGPGWEFKGHVSRWSAGGAGKWSYTVGTQGHYAGCTVVTGCIVDDYPWLQLKVLGNGAWTKTSATG